jgi:hypothetical protein
MAAVKKLWHDPVWSKVIASLILAAIGVSGAYFLDWWELIRRLFSGALYFATIKTSVPNWALGLLGLLSLPSIFLLVISFWRGIFLPNVTGNWRLYVSDVFFGIHWRWRYFDDGGIYDLCSFCPDCDLQIYPNDISYTMANYRTVFRCDNCERDLCELHMSHSDLENRVKRNVQQKLRNGTWVVPN